MFYFCVDSNSAEQVIGVLNDYDLSSMKDVPIGRERTGTVSFMVLGLLTKKAVEGNVEHLYQHDAESFIWVLTWVSLQYEDGKPLREGRLLDGWLKENATGCSEKKLHFLYLGSKSEDLRASTSHLRNWMIAESCLQHIATCYSVKPVPILDDDVVFRKWLEAEVHLSI
jgi:hypothetical protein